MDVDEVAAFIPQLLEGQFPGRWRAAFPGAGDDAPGRDQWILEANGTYCYLLLSRASNPFLWLKFGLAQAIPRTDALAWKIAGANRKLVVGRAFLAWGDQIAMAVLDDTIFTESLSWEHQATFQDLINHIHAGISHATELQAELLSEFGGAPFAGEDWVLLMM